LEVGLALQRYLLSFIVAYKIQIWVKKWLKNWSPRNTYFILTRKKPLIKVTNQRCMQKYLNFTTLTLNSSIMQS